MEEAKRGISCFRFGDYLLDPEREELLKGSKGVRLQNLPFQVLLLLVESRGRIVLRQEIKERIWPNGTFVEFDQGLNTAIRKLRRALDDSTVSPRFVETVPRRGYRFLSTVEEIPSEFPVEESEERNEERRFSVTRFVSQPASVALSLIGLVFLGLFLIQMSSENHLGAAAADDILSTPIVGSLELSESRRKGLRAEDEYSKGVFYLSRASLSEALESFERSVRLDPNRSEAYSAIAFGLILTDELSPDARFPRARKAAFKALELNPENSSAYVALGMIKYLYEWDWQEGEKLLLQSRGISHNRSAPHTIYADYLNRVGRSSEALTEIRLARNISPQNLATHSRLADTYYFARQYEQAIQQIQTILALDPKHATNHNRLGKYFSMVGRYEDAILALQKALSLKSGNPYSVGMLGYVYGISGQRQRAKLQLDRLHIVSKHSYVPSYDIAMIHLGLGEKEAALGWLEKAYEERDPSLTLLRVEPLLDPLRSNPRFQAIVHRMNLPQRNRD